MNLKRTIVLLLCLVMLFSMTACQQKASTPDTESTPQATDKPVVNETEDQDEVTTDEEYFAKYYKKFDPVVTLTQNKNGGPDAIWEEGDSIDNNNFTRWAERTVGIDWQSKWVCTTNEDSQKLSLAIASDKLPDVIKVTTTAEVRQLAEAGQIMPLNDAIDKYVSPLGKKLLNDMNKATNGMHFKQNYYNGELYAMPEYSDMVSPPGNYWRKDILTQLGFESAPSSLDDVEKVFAAYKEAYPDNYCINVDKALTHGVNAVFTAYGTQANGWRDVDGKLVYAPTLPQTKEALQRLASWYEKGYIDKEFIADDVNTAMEPWEAGNQLMIQREWWIGWSSHLTLQVNVPEALIECGDYFVGPEGEWGALPSKPSEFGHYAINSKCTEEQVEAIFVHFNYFVDSAFRSHKDLRDEFKFYYPYKEEPLPNNTEELAAEREAGNVVHVNHFDLTAEEEGPCNGQNTWTAVGVSAFDQFGICFKQRPDQLRNDYLNIEKFMAEGNQEELDKITVYGQMKNLWSENNLNAMFENLKWAQKAEAEGRIYFDQQFCSPTETQLQKDAYLSKIESETFAKIIMGEAPIEAFDQFVEDWYNNGGTEITEELNEWYSSLG